MTRRLPATLFAVLALVVVLTAAAASSEGVVDFARASETAATRLADVGATPTGPADSAGDLQALMHQRVEQGLVDASTEPSESLLPLAGIVLALAAVHVTLFGLLRRRGVAG